jgi:selenocysteine lyase/cysteine desulfurase
MTFFSRRDFARLVALSGSASLLPVSAWARGDVLDRFDATAAPLPQTPANPTEAFWRDVRARFLVPRDLTFLNSANLCPASLASIEAMEKYTRLYEACPTPEVRTELMAKGRAETRKLLADALRVTPDEVVITRNTSEGNNFISSGLDFKPGDEVVVWADNHPSNLNAWRLKAQRFGFTVVTVPIVNAHPGTQGYVDLFTKAMTARTKLVAITHVNSNSGDLLPAAEICAAARERGVLSLVDGAQAFGVLDLDLEAMKPDFYTGSMHKWPCGPKEKGVLYVNKPVHDRIHPTVVGVYAGEVGISRTLEATGQRDDASMAAVADALKFQGSIGRGVIEKRARQLAQTLMTELKKLPGVKLWTDPDPSRSAAIVIFPPGTLDVRRLGAALTAARIVCTTRTGAQMPGLRLSPHFYNTMDEVDRVVGAIRKYLASGV